ncbi:MAG: hypothetical protein F6K22_29820 [Okeania sp. SIO2F4]|uniref:NACHT C-terminal helical domain 2-containing protein n=1 Tax=Okeania sp. SIO2F4 TaxID=2607790 RepID=UPI00142C7DC1|nr:hypothetical protein [Okeania sp. SIO2F4]NES06649.1 hypothetical protein [Okeania sp. SIO2F4]
MIKERIDLELKSALKKLKDELPDQNQTEEQFHPIFGSYFDVWWKINRKDWANKLREVIIKHRDISHNWQFISSQIELLQKYYDANVILIECLRSDCFLTREVRDKIEDELFLPMAEIEKRKEQK